MLSRRVRQCRGLTPVPDSSVAKQTQLDCTQLPALQVIPRPPTVLLNHQASRVCFPPFKIGTCSKSIRRRRWSGSQMQQTVKECLSDEMALYIDPGGLGVGMFKGFKSK